MTFFVAVAITPVGGGSEGGAWVATLGLLLPFSLFDPTEHLLSRQVIILTLGVWAGLYAMSVGMTVIVRMILRRAQLAS